MEGSVWPRALASLSLYHHPSVALLNQGTQNNYTILGVFCPGLSYEQLAGWIRIIGDKFADI